MDIYENTNIVSRERFETTDTDEVYVDLALADDRIENAAIRKREDHLQTNADYRDYQIASSNAQPTVTPLQDEIATSHVTKVINKQRPGAGWVGVMVASTLIAMALGATTLVLFILHQRQLADSQVESRHNLSLSFFSFVLCRSLKMFN